MAESPTLPPSDPPGLVDRVSASFLALLPLVFCTHLDDAVESPKLAFALLVLAILLAREGLPTTLPRRPVFVALGAFWLSMTVSFGLNGLWEGSLALVQTGLGVAFAWVWLSQPSAPANWSAWVVWGWWGSAIYSWLQRLGMDPFGWNNPHLSAELTIAGLGNPNFLGFYLAVLAPLAWVEGLRCQQRIPVSLLWIGAVGAMILTGTRASWLALGAGLFVLAAGAWRWHPSLRRPLASTVLLLLLSLPLLRAVPLAAATGETAGQRAVEMATAKAASTQTRLMLWRAALIEVSQHPVLGWGEGWFPYRALLHRDREPMELRPLQRVPENPHNQYLDVLFHCGGLGFILYCAVGVMALRSAWRAAAATPVGLALLAGLAAYAVNSLFIDAPLTQQILLIWLIVAVEEPCRPLPSKNLSAGRLLAVFLVCASIAVVVCEACLWQGDDDLSRARAFYERATVCAPPWRTKHVRLRLLKSDPDPIVGLKDLCRRYPEDPYIWAFLASRCESLGRDTDSITAYWKEAMARDPYNPGFHFQASRWFWRTQDYLQALREIDTSLAIYPEKVEAWFQKALVLHTMGREEEALKAWQEALVREPKQTNKRPW